ncbi:oligomeric complex COG6-domain-containing protein [Cercophora scortea]|uniref:Conserved oligomeric Golgi complex subunit 6 n=1 Tax=Cercophora scortea TaxID=314031 RepID=A0AAE0I7Q2_9PEZI|nr:oligomeric complex COG6-domain-containing protein [Cercophora scortea]
MASRDSSDLLSPTTQTKGPNPLSSKVASVLSTSYADTEFREALALLDERRGQNTAETRRRLRLDLQKEVIDSNGDIINEFGKVAEQLRRIGNTIGKLNESYQEMKTQISAAHTATASTLDEASQLMTQRQQIERKQDLLKAFNANFTFSEDEVAALTLTSEPVNDLFFAVLSKAKKISRDCEVLLGFEAQALGLEIMEQASRNLNLGFQKLYRWIQREFKTLNLENPQIGSSIRRALRVLAERPSLFQNCLDFFAEARENVLSDSFYTALTGSAPSGAEDPSVKPIELLAHDPLRYVGDMLAWSHSAAVGEKEALEVLFVSEGDEIAKGIQAGRDNEVWRLVAEDGEDAPSDFDAVTALNELVDRVMSGAVRILRQRVEQVIQTNEDTILAYKLANLLNFYKATFSKLLGPGSGLVDSMGVLESEALRLFRSLARDHVATLQGDFQHTPSDLRPPDFLTDALEQLSAIMKTYETSLTSAGDREADFEPVMAEAFDPFITGCGNMARTVRQPADSVFFINCLLAAKHALSRFDFTTRHVAELERTMDVERVKLVESQYAFFRGESGLDGLISGLAGLKEKDEDAAKVKGLEAVQAAALTRASQMLDDFLPSALMDATENLKHLQDSKLARDITEEAAERFCVDFEHVEEMLMLADELAMVEKGSGSGSEEDEEEEDGDASAGACMHGLDPGSLAQVMLRNRTAASVLQKTYDESYLTCSTAVYYESQGDEAEAMRCWKLALDQIYDHHANRVLPNYTPRSETEKALVDSLRRLELQCKERIDLLEALRLSRHEALQQQDSSSSGPGPSKSSDSSDPGPGPGPGSSQQDKGWIGGGTIPAATYMDLSRPELPKRPSLSTRTSSEQAVVGDRGIHARLDNGESPSSSSRPLASPSSLPPPPEEKSPRRHSPERHTMRTTLRPSRLGDKSSSKSSLKRPAPKPADGPGASKAASLAWSAINQRESTQSLSNTTQLISTASQVVSAPSSSSSAPFLPEHSRRVEAVSHKQWDRHSRRLVSPHPGSPARTPGSRPSSDPNILRHSDEYSHLPPSLSVSAASSALNSLSLRDDHRRISPERESLTRNLTAPPQTPQRRLPRQEMDDTAVYSAEPTNRSLTRKTSSDPTLISRKPVGQSSSKPKSRPPAPNRSTPSATDTTKRRTSKTTQRLSPSSTEESSSAESPRKQKSRPKRREPAQREASIMVDPHTQLSESSGEEDGKEKDADSPDRIAALAWKNRKAALLKRLPAGVDEHAAKQILNEIVVQGDEVHWSDIAGLDVAKAALREAVVYPFLRPDLFMGLREPARGMLLFGPPGTGKTMLARAVATESKSTFFSISASSLTSKYLGESEKLVRALFSLAKVLAPSIIFVDEIDSLLSQRSGSGEHEATRRIKTEFLIQWSDLQRAAAGRDVTTERERERGDANRVLVLAATNLPWAIDEAARRRFVRRQYIPLPEAETRTVHLKTLLGSQKHTLTDEEIAELVGLTDGFSGSDITALAKDAAMGPLRSLGEALLSMTMDQIRPIELGDFKASLVTIRPSVSKTGLKEYEDWAAEFGERGG